MKRILVADDNLWEVRDLIKKLQLQYLVEHVKDGRSALYRINQGGLAAAILDHDMLPEDVLAHEAESFYGSNVAKTARNLHPDLALVLRSTIADRFSLDLKPYDVFCHNKGWGHKDDDPIFDYLRRRL